MRIIRPCVVETLEQRTLLAAHPAYSTNFLNNTLTVTGSRRSPNQIVVALQTGQSSAFVVFIDGKVVDAIPRSEGVQFIVLRGGSKADSIQFENPNATGGAQAIPVLIVGGAGDDTLTGGSGNDTLVGGPGNDVFYDGNGNAYIDGGAGNDVITTGAGNDTINGGAGNDVIIVHTISPVLSGVPQTVPNDFLNGGPGNDVIVAGVGNDVVSGGPGGDSLVGGTGNDTLLGGAGRDSLVGGPGFDTMFGGGGGDKFFGLPTLDVVEDRRLGERVLQPTSNTTPAPTPPIQTGVGTVATAKAGDGSVQSAGGHAGGVGDPVVTDVLANNGAISTFLIQDASGAIEVSGDSDAIYSPSAGDTVAVTGSVISPNGQYQFAFPTSVIKTGTAPLPAVQTFTIASLTNGSSVGLAEQSELGNLNDITFTGANSTGNFEAGAYTVTGPNNPGTGVVVIPAGSNMIGVAISTMAVNIYGYLAQDDGTLVGSDVSSSTNGYQLAILSFTPATTV